MARKKKRSLRRREAKRAARRRRAKRRDRDFLDVSSPEAVLASMIAEIEKLAPELVAEWDDDHPLTQEERAMVLVEQAAATSDPEEGRQLLERALELDPNCSAAHIELAKLAFPDKEKVFEQLHLAVEAARRSLGGLYGQIPDEDFLTIPTALDYLEAVATLGRVSYNMEAYQEAAEAFQEVFRLDPVDRYDTGPLLACALVLLGRDKDAWKVYACARKDRATSETAWRYISVLLTFRREGPSPATRIALRKALKANRHVPSYLVGESAEPEELPDRGKPGSFHEAILVASSQHPAWRATPDALEWLAGRIRH